jgi:hypothetical protein
MTQSLLLIFPNLCDLLALEPEELGGVILEVAPMVMQNGLFTSHSFLAQLFTSVGPSYPHGNHRKVELAIAEAMSWLETQGLIIHDPGQPSPWFTLTRRGKNLRTRADVEAYRKGRMLPVELLQPKLADKVWPLFLRGDHDVAVFQAYKEIEVATRRTSNSKGAGYPDDLVGIALMRKAFHPENGPLRDEARVAAEREAEMHLFSGAIGHIRNPVGHHEVNLSPLEAARLIVFSSHLLGIIEARAGASSRKG